jgi:hypothetical protein
MEEQPIPKPKGKGNWGGKGVIVGNEGNESPKWLRNIPRTRADMKPGDKINAEDVSSQYAAESTYSPWANNNAVEHMGALHQHLENLRDALGAAGLRPRRAESAMTALSEAHETASAPGGWAAHPAVGDAMERVKDHLDNISSQEDLPDSVTHHLEKAHASAAGYHRAFNPLAPSTFKTFGSDPSRVSLEVNKSYYPMNVPADLTYVPREPKGSKIFTADKETGAVVSRDSDPKKNLEATPEAKSYLSIKTQAAKAAKGYKKPVKNNSEDE